MSTRTDEPYGIPVGPYSTAFSLSSGGILHIRGGVGTAGANPLVVLRRTAFASWSSESDERCTVDSSAVGDLLRWAERESLGQDKKLLEQARARRARSLRALERDGYTVARLHARVQWRLIIGLGTNDNAHGIGTISLHGTYGWPFIPASGIKGLTAAWALQSDTEPVLLTRIFGSPRPRDNQDEDDDSAASPADGAEEPAHREGVLFLDALPTAVARVRTDVVTPHAQPYYEQAELARNGRPTKPVPPAEHHQPVPVSLLTVQQATFAVDLAGRDGDLVAKAADWLSEAGDELGAGAKTSAGYGYLKVAPDPAWQPQPAPSAED